jgi:hypothetical protein
VRLVRPKPKPREQGNNPSIPLVSEGFGYRIEGGRPKPTTSPIKLYRGTKDDSVGVGNYDINPPPQKVKGAPFGRDTLSR